MAACVFCSSILLLLKSISSSVISPNDVREISADIATAPVAYDRRLRVMTYNIKQIPNWLGLHAWDQDRRVNELVEAINDNFENSTAPDVIVFNELLSASAFADLGKHLRELYPFYTNVIGKDCASKAGWTSLTGNCHTYLPRGGVNIFSRHPIDEVHGLVFDNKGKGTWDHLCNKGAVLAKLMVDGTRPVWIMGTHLQSDEGGVKGGLVREQQAEEFTAWIDSNIARGDFNVTADQPIIVAGDLNVEFLGTPRDYAKMLELTKLRVNYTRGGDTPGSFSGSTNWLAKGVLFQQSATLDYDDTLDYIGYRTDFKNPIYAPSQRVVPLKAASAWYWGFMKGWWNLPSKGWIWNNGFYNDISDHYPVIADFFF